ncbi:gliding motility-associated-like protein [Chitinophaga skermanii]|uniref:Gliding motility-associated-like protein n=1 Tax=Chitinophaga skermanii TaxID=331697 RepID=A0A327QEJ3_9BACT|nr:M43 family zinc metalloprotease [Chitinophaga skermanii]RAJ02425.1 gliding motility-associated-like protein [Chitinophaga skermanii]
MDFQHRFANIWLTLLFLCIPLFLRAQTPQPSPRGAMVNVGGQQVFSCGTDVLQNKLRDNQAFRIYEAEMNRRIRQQSYKTALMAPSTYTLPVVFHIIHQDPSSITDADVIAALQMLNDAYGQSGPFAGARTNTQIQFCLAKTDPNGGKTTGILRNKTYLGDFDADMEGDDIVNLGKWDGSRYINIWVVEDIKSEFMQSFECGKWQRLKMGGYASAGGDIVVAGLGVGVLAHEMGHYLSLMHTFAAMDCKNNDCAVDGDMVCDTPPDKSIKGGFDCSNPENSCDTDTLSGFTTDVPDLPDNFMDYGGGTGCISSFTEGQAARMRNFIATSLTGMISTTVCNEPCTGAVTAGFTRTNTFPLIGDAVTFTNTSTGTTDFEWYIDDVLTATTADLTFTPTAKKNYYITLRAKDASGCFASAYDVVQVSCGVVARFTPDKRKIASKENVETDDITFTNRSENATSFTWYMSNDKSMADQVVATSKDLTWTFKEPGVYKIRLEATNGTCTDVSDEFTFTVDDPTADGTVYLQDIHCYQEDKLRISFFFHNDGYKTIPANVPVSFYDSDPRLPGAKKIGEYIIPYEIKGKCSSYLENIILTTGSKVDQVFAVFNDVGLTIPVVLPNTTVEERSYTNNFRSKKNFQFKIAITPALHNLVPGDTVRLQPKSVQGGDITSATWTNADFLDCTNCIEPLFTAAYRRETATSKEVIAMSKYGCTDRAYVNFTIPTVDDYSVKIDGTECAANNGIHIDFTLCNAYTKGNIPGLLKVDFYDDDPAVKTANYLGSFTVPSAGTASDCQQFGVNVDGSATHKVYAHVNPAKDTLETNYANNLHQALYNDPQIQITGLENTVWRKTTLPVSFTTQYFTPVVQTWQIVSGYSDISCTNCPTAQVTIYDTSLVKVNTVNRYGCKIEANAVATQFPPDLTVNILSAKCYSNTSTIVNFELCIGNYYDYLYEKLPVSFYDGNSSTGKLIATYYTPAITWGNCGTFSFILNTPITQQLTAVVNDPGGSKDIEAGRAFNEMDYTNNTAHTGTVPFVVSFDPPTIALKRPLGTTTLQPVIEGGPARSFFWLPAEGLSCSDCETPVVLGKGASQVYKVRATNEYFCTSIATLNVQTFVDDRLLMPTAFSPNNDGVNDVLYVIGSRDIAKVKNFVVYDRWGKKVFEVHDVPANDKQYGWQGLVNGMPADAGSFIYLVELQFNNNETQLFKGSVLLVR